MSTPDFSTVQRQRVLGILDGVSHQSGADYFTGINGLVQSQCPQKYAGNSSRLVMWCANLEEYVACLVAGRFDLVTKMMVHDGGARSLVSAGAEVILIASNTTHLCFDALEEYLATDPLAVKNGVEALHIIDCVAATLRSRFPNDVGHRRLRVGFLGTKFSVTSGHIAERLSRHGHDLVVLRSDDDIDEMQRIIEKELSAGVTLESSRVWVRDVIRREFLDADAVLLGCTEIGLLVKQDDVPEVPIIDSAQEHMRVAVDVQLFKKTVAEVRPPPSSNK
eukprot:PhM_4_TR12393/c0_g1_i1/m.57332/K01779/racD; aspartate racemase